MLVILCKYPSDARTLCMLNLTSHHFTSLHYTSLPIFHFPALSDVPSPPFKNSFSSPHNYFLKICDLHGKVASASVGSWFHSVIVLFTKEYLPMSIPCCMWPAPCRKFFPRYLTNGMFFGGKKVFEHKTCVLNSPTNFRLQTFSF